MTFKQLEALYWIVQLGGFAAAARKLSATQSAVSKRIQDLETEFDTELFDRTQRAARLTEKGEQMYELARELLEHRDSAVERFSRPDTIRRRVRIGVTELSAMTWLPRLVRKVQQHYPKVTIQPDVDLSVTLRDKLLADEIDLVVVSDILADARFFAKPAGKVENAWMCKRGMLPSDRPLDLEELAAHTLLIQGSKSGTGLVYDQWFKSLSVNLDNIIISDSVIALMGMTVSGLGVSYLPQRCLAQWIEQGALDVLETRPPPPAIQYVAMCRASNPSTLISSIIDLTCESCDFSRIFQIDG